MLPPDVPQRFLPVRSKPEGIVYEPGLFATATVHYLDAKRGIDHAEEVSLLAPLTDEGPDWYAAEPAELTRDGLEAEPVAGARFAPLPDAAVKAKSYDAWRKTLEECLYRTSKCELFRSDTIGLVSSPGESERDFRIRLTESAREKRDEQVEALRKKYGVKIAQLQERIRRAEQAKEVQQAQARQQTLSTVISAGSAVLGMFFGRKRSMSSIGTAARGAGRTFQEQQDVVARRRDRRGAAEAARRPQRRAGERGRQPAGPLRSGGRRAGGAGPQAAEDRRRGPFPHPRLGAETGKRAGLEIAGRRLRYHG